VIQRGERSGKEVVKDRKEILKEERIKKIKEEKREKTREVEEKIAKEEKEVEMQGFSGGEILKGRYPLV